MHMFDAQGVYMWLCSCSFLRQHTDGTEGQWLITGSESWPGYVVLTNSVHTQLSANMLVGLTELYGNLYWTTFDQQYQFDSEEFVVEESSIKPDVVKFYEVQIGRDRYCGIEHEKERRAADVYVLKKNDRGNIALFAVQIQYFIRHRVRVKHRRRRTDRYVEQDEWHTFAVVLNYKAAPGMALRGQDIQHPDKVAFQMDLESIQDRYGVENYIPIRLIAGRFIKVPAVAFQEYIDLKRVRQASRHLEATTGFRCAPLPPKH
jgi:hypothetical protein